MVYQNMRAMSSSTARGKLRVAVPTGTARDTPT
jgi:hypothetical protein